MLPVVCVERSNEPLSCSSTDGRLSEYSYLIVRASMAGPAEETELPARRVRSGLAQFDASDGIVSYPLWDRPRPPAVRSGSEQADRGSPFSRRLSCRCGGFM